MSGMRRVSATRPDSESLLRVSSDIVFVDARRGATFDEVNDDCFPSPEQLAAGPKRNAAATTTSATAKELALRWRCCPWQALRRTVFQHLIAGLKV